MYANNGAMVPLETLRELYLFSKQKDFLYHHLSHPELAVHITAFEIDGYNLNVLLKGSWSRVEEIVNTRM